MSLFFFLQYSILRKSEYAYYALYLGVLSCYYVAAIPELFFSQTALNENTWIREIDDVKRPLQYLSSVFYTYFIIYYLGLQHTSLKLHRFLKFLIIIYIILSITCFILNRLNIDFNQAYYLMSLLLLPVQFYIVFSLFKNKVPYSRYIIWGTIIILVGSTVTLAMSIYFPRTEGLMRSVRLFLPAQLCILIDMFLFTVALQKKIADNERSLLDSAVQRQRAVLVERERIIADLHDDVGGGLSSIRMMSDLMAQQAGQENTSNTVSFAQKISSTAKDIAQRMHTIIWSLNMENDTLQNMVEYVRQYGVSFFENSPVKFTANNDHNIDPGIQLKGGVRKNLFLIIKEAFHNILKHATASEAYLHVSIEGNKLLIEVKDNGTGIRNPNQFGNGIRNMRKRAEEINGKLTINSNGGTQILTEVELEKVNR